MKYSGEKRKEISFPLGGIGTGSIGIAGDGRLRDWEIFNRPAKGSTNRYTHFAIRAVQGEKVTAAVINGDVMKEFSGSFRIGQHVGYGYGPDSEGLGGMPHFRNVEFIGEFPFAELLFSDENFPANVRLTAFNPLIPHDEDNSSIPAAFFEVEAENTTEEEIIYQVAFSVSNPYETGSNSVSCKNGITTLKLCNSGVGKDDISYGDISVATDCEKAYTQTYWYRGMWKDSIVSFWNEFTSPEGLCDRVYDEPGKKDTGTIAGEIRVAPKEKKKVRFVLSWNVPNNYNYWNEYKDKNGNHITWKNYYATIFEDSERSAGYSLENWENLYDRTLKFRNALHTQSIPEEVIDAASANLSVLKTATVLRLEDGSFYGWEGIQQDKGSCEGTCQHVWNYAYALCYLFPRLELSIREQEFKYTTLPDGKMYFRMMLPPGREDRWAHINRACLDGQMGSVIKCYREWKISGNNKWLRDNWENIKKILEYAWSENNPDRWDIDKDGVLEGRQHHTLDVELFGPSSWLEGFYLAALKAASKMARFVGDTEKEKEYTDLFEKGFKWTKENLFNGKYFVQKIDLKDKSITDSFDASHDYWNDETGEIKYQIKDGSIIDQMLAQWHADLLGLGDIFDREQVKIALSNMMKNNFKKSVRDFMNPWRLFSINDESASVICDYPRETDKPKIPIPYCEETMTGFEYSFAGLLCSRGLWEEGLKVTKAVRDRFDGEKRNPWNEFECGSNYARSMASYALIPILSGFEFDLPNKYIGFNPYKKGAFKAVWSVGNAWGEFEIKKDKVFISISEGEIMLSHIGLKFADEVKLLKIDCEAIDFEFKNGKIYFEESKISKEVEIAL